MGPSRDWMRSHAVVVLVRDRFYHSSKRDGRVMTAWSIVGATLFADGPDEARISAIEQRLLDRGYSPVRALVAIAEYPEPVRGVV